MSVLQRAAGSSAIARRLRRWAGEWSPDQEQREVEQVRALLSTSRLAAAVSRPIHLFAAAWRHSRLRRVSDAAQGLDAAALARLIGWALIVAVFCHTVLFAVIGVRVGALGWAMRTVLLALGAAGFFRPETWAAAWKDRQSGGS